MLDAFSLSRNELLDRHPTVYPWLLERVKPERDLDPRRGHRENWWLFLIVAHPADLSIASTSIIPKPEVRLWLILGALLLATWRFSCQPRRGRYCSRVSSSTLRGAVAARVWILARTKRSRINRGKQQALAQALYPPVLLATQLLQGLQLNLQLCFRIRFASLAS